MSSDSVKKTSLLKEVFDFLDKARENKIEFEEVMRVVSDTDQKTQNTIRKAFDKADKAKNGTLDFNEFKNMIK
jgi:Ca2+-binding EF-hand superfamily protein